MGRDKKSVANPLDGRAAGGELLFEFLEAVIEVIDAVDRGHAFGGQSRDHQRHRRAQIGRHHLRTFEPWHALDGGGVAAELDARAERDKLSRSTLGLIQ